MQTIEVEAKTLEEAKLQAAGQLNCEPDALHFEILEEKKGILGMGKKVKIRASGNSVGQTAHADTPFPAPTGQDDAPQEIPDWAMNPDFDPQEALEVICKNILDEAYVETGEREGRLLLQIKGDGSGIFIGRKGQTLEALQFIINKMHLKQTGRPNHIVVDSEGYVERRIAKLKDKAYYLADSVRNSRRPQTTEPLNAHDRRIIHTTLRTKDGIMTRSIGDGEFKRVQISLRRER